STKEEIGYILGGNFRMTPARVQSPIIIQECQDQVEGDQIVDGSAISMLDEQFNPLRFLAYHLKNMNKEFDSEINT
uniref:hypothetical protein n=1 Tax=Serratia quinivorans TaxID=137545 RepID=UPI0035C73761